MQKPADITDRTQVEIDHLDALLDEALRGTFPASDPVAISLPPSRRSPTDERERADLTQINRAVDNVMRRQNTRKRVNWSIYGSCR